MNLSGRTRIGIFGGTFDPPHIGHLILAAEAHSQLQLDRLLWVVTPDPPHKQGRNISPLSVRLDLLRAALAGNPGFEVSRADIDRPPPHYALGTVLTLRQEHPDAYLIYLMGGDSLHDLPTWHRPLDFLAACDGLGVMCRPGYLAGLAELEKQLPGLSAKTRLLQAPLLEISSSEIRRRVASGGHFRYYLPQAVYQLVLQKGLYLPHFE